MIRTTLIFGDGHRTRTEGLALASNPPPDATVWVDVLATSAAGLAKLPPEWRFHPLALEDCIHPQRRSKYERFPHHTFIVMQALDTSTDAALDTTAVRIFLQGRLVVTVHDRPVPALERVVELLDLDGERVGTGADRLLHALLDAVIDEFIPLLERWEDELDAIENRAARDHELNVLPELVELRRQVLVLRRMVLPQHEVLRRILEGFDASEPGALYFRDVLDHVNVISDSAALLVDLCAGAIEVQQERANARLNRVMKYLALVSTMLLPMTVISGAFGMNFDHIPDSHSPYGFWHAVVLMLASAAALVVWFRRKRWM